MRAVVQKEQRPSFPTQEGEGRHGQGYCEGQDKDRKCQADVQHLEQSFRDCHPFLYHFETLTWTVTPTKPSSLGTVSLSFIVRKTGEDEGGVGTVSYLSQPTRD